MNGSGVWLDRRRVGRGGRPGGGLAARVGRARVAGGAVRVAGVQGAARRAGARALRRGAARARARAQPARTRALRHAHAVGQPGTSTSHQIA